MKATGIVRRIDDLGRVVVPKEIRRTLRIREGDPLLTTLIEYTNADKQGIGEQIGASENVAKPLLEDKISRAKRELFIGGMIGLAESVGKANG